MLRGTAAANHWVFDEAKSPSTTADARRAGAKVDFLRSPPFASQRRHLGGSHAPGFDTGASMLASRASTHLPFCFFKIDSVWPARVIGAAPPGGVTSTFNLAHINAQSPKTLIS